MDPKVEYPGSDDEEPPALVETTTAELNELSVHKSSSNDRPAVKVPITIVTGMFHLSRYEIECILSSR